MIIALDNITVEEKKHFELYFNKVFARSLPYILCIILALIILFAIFTGKIIDSTKYFIDAKLYLKIAVSICIFCLAVLFSPVYRMVESLIKYHRIMFSFRIKKKYSNTEKYLNSLDSEKIQRVPLFESLERPISIPSEDFLGFNLLSASFYYNSIINSFDPNINLVKIIDAKKGMGKTSFINLILHRINGLTYHHDNNCQLVLSIFNRQQIKVVQFSVLPLFVNLESSEKECINNFVKMIADNLVPALSKYLKAVLASTTAFNNTFNLEKFIDHIASNNTLSQMKSNLKISEQKHLIIIEDLDRLDEKNIKIFVKALWFIHDLPFTITLLPGEESKIRTAFNLPTKPDQRYEELEEYKLLQFSFSLKDYFYKFLANYTIKIYDDTIRKLQIDNELVLLEKLKSNVISQDNIQNDWVSHLYKNNLISKNNVYMQIRSHNKDIINSVKAEIINVCEKYNLSIREFKTIIGKLRIGGDRLFIIQQIIFYMLEYRYKYQDGIIEYLNKYDVWGNFKKNHYLTTYQDRFLNDKLDNFPDAIKEMIVDLVRFPRLNINEGMNSFINSLFGFLGRNYRHTTAKLDNNTSVNILASEFITIFLTNSKGSQGLYDNLSLNWHDNFDKLSMSCSDEFILAFNERAETTVAINTKDHQFSYNLFLFQNFAILLLIMIRSNSNILNKLNNYFHGDKLYNQSISIYNEFYATNVSFEINIMIDYYRRLFNIDHDNFIHDNTNCTLKNNYEKLKEKLISTSTDSRFIAVFARIFKEHYIIKNQVVT